MAPQWASLCVVLALAAAAPPAGALPSLKKCPNVRLLHGSGYLPQNTFEKYWARYGAPGKRIGMILNGGGGLEQGEAAFRSRASQMSTAMGGVPEENFVFIPLYGTLCPDTANDPAVAELIASLDAVYMPGGNQGMLAACIYGVISDSGVDSPEDTLAAVALRTVPMVGGDSAGAMNQPSAPMMSRHDEDWTSCFPCDECCGESYCALTNGCVFTRNVGNRLIDQPDMMIHTHVAERGRQGFLLVSILMHLEDGITQGIGADEGAALYCSNEDSWCECLSDAGRGVWVYVGTTGTIEATSAEMHFLSNGDRWNSETNQVTFAEDKILCSTLLRPVEPSDTIFNSGFTPGAQDYRRIALETSRTLPGTEVLNTHGSTFEGKPPVYANFYRTEGTVAMCDTLGEHRSFSGMRTVQGFVAPSGWSPDLTHEPIEYRSDYRDEM